jgi:hypothetical protein
MKWVTGHKLSVDKDYEGTGSGPIKISIYLPTHPPTHPPTYLPTYIWL